MRIYENLKSITLTLLIGISLILTGSLWFDNYRELSLIMAKLPFWFNETFDFDKVESLSIECRQKLKKYSPRTIAQASRISGVSPADISVLLIYFGR